MQCGVGQFTLRLHEATEKRDPGSTSTLALTRSEGYLWVALGVPYEQAFVAEFSPRLTKVGVIKTCGGLFNFLSGSRARAPEWMQNAGLEWAWRIWLEPRRMFWRYLTTNPRALYLLFNQSRPSDSDRNTD